MSTERSNSIWVGNRRLFIAHSARASGVVIAAAAFPHLLTGCSPQAQSTAGSVTSAVGRGLGFVPHVHVRTASSIIQFVGGILSAVGSVRTFHAGEILHDLPGNYKQKKRYDKPGALQAAFSNSSKGSGEFSTPVVRLTASKRELYVQCSKDSPHYSLVRGAQGTAYLIHDDWVDFLINDDCDLKVASHSRFTSCGINGCKVWVKKQKFIYPWNDGLTLMQLADKDASHNALQQHFRHVEKFKGCPALADCGTAEVTKMRE